MIPDGGFRPTFMQYSMDQQPKILDHIMCRGAPAHKQRVTTLRVQADWVRRSGHNALELQVQCFFKCDKRPERPDEVCANGTEAHPGQIASLVLEAAWADAAHLQRALLWAESGAAHKGRKTKKATPFDAIERRASAEQRATHDRQARRVLALWTFQIRAYQKRWRFEQELAEYTTRGRSVACCEKMVPTGVTVTPAGTTRSMRDVGNLRRGHKRGRGLRFSKDGPTPILIPGIIRLVESTQRPHATLHGTRAGFPNTVHVPPILLSPRAISRTSSPCTPKRKARDAVSNDVTGLRIDGGAPAFPGPLGDGM